MAPANALNGHSPGIDQHSGPKPAHFLPEGKALKKNIGVQRKSHEKLSRFGGF